MSHPRTKRGVPRALAIAAIVAGASAALAVAAPSKDAVLAAPDVRVPAGDVLVLHGRGFPHDVHVTLRAGRDAGTTERIGGAHTGRRGGFVAQVHIDPDAAPGRYVALACHDRCRVKATLHFHVQSP